MKQIAAREAVDLLRFMTRVLCAVGTLALVFTTVNVTRFATSRDIPRPIAILLDPMIGIALAGVLYVDARLASWGIRPPAWSTALRWGAGCIAALMNTWESLWPDRQIGWPRQADPAAVLLHLAPALLLIALTETIAAYRRTITDLMNRTGAADPLDHRIQPPAAPLRSPRGCTDPDTTDPDQPEPPHLQDRSDPRSGSTSTLAPTGAGLNRPHKDSDTFQSHPPTPGSILDSGGAADTDVWHRAIALDNAARTISGMPVSIWRLRTDLHIGPRRARQIRDRLLSRCPDPSS